MKTRYVIFNNDDEQGTRAWFADKEAVFRFFRGECPELFTVEEYVSDGHSEERGNSLNGQEWLAENTCPCCGRDAFRLTNTVRAMVAMERHQG